MSDDMTGHAPNSASRPAPPRAVSRRFLLKAGAAAGLAAPLSGLFPKLSGIAEAAESATPVIPPLPSMVGSVRQPVIDLSGKWHFTTAPPPDFWAPGTGPSGWPAITVPGEPAMQDIPVPQNAECAYKTLVTVPADFAGQRVFLRFDGIYSYARLWVAGNYVRDHDGGFTTWYADITGYVTPGQPVWITLGVTDRSTSIAGASAYAHHNIGGILREVTMVALPTDYLTAVHTSTTFDSSYVNATLHACVAAQISGTDTARVQLRLTGPDGRPVRIQPDTVTLSAAAPQASLGISVPAAQKWDAEHPNLYTLTAALQSRSASETVTRQIGLRQVEIRGNTLLLNGQQIHLRGADHHHVSPTLGRSTTASLDEQDITLLKDANVNFIRTSHYPPTPALLAAADRHGMYIEEEAPVCFQYGTVDDPAYQSQYLSQFAEMIERDRDHACVIEWSLGNESGYGRNFTAENSYEHQADTTRPTVFEDAAQNNGGNQADIYSGHYPQWNGRMGNPSQPIQYGEYAHLPNYDLSTLQNDPGVHNFWGQSVARFPVAFHGAAGVVGGAIWAGIDDIFELSSGTVGYGEWGLLDIWRRPKTEHWLAKKAYSPVRIQDQPLAQLDPRSPITVPVTNWHDFTNLRELTVQWRINGNHGTMNGPDIAPQENGTLTIPAQPWQSGDVLALEFRTRSGGLVDEYKLPLGTPAEPAFPGAGGTAPAVSDTPSSIEIRGADAPFAITFSKSNGRITEATYSGTTIITGGPELDLPGASLGPWTQASITSSTGAHEVVVTINGSYGDVPLRFDVAVDGRGLITTTYAIANPPQPAAGGYSEVGISYQLTQDIDTLSWQRTAQWSAYPDDHIGRGRGIAARTRPGPTDTYRVAPSWPWSQDMRDYYLFGKDSGLHWTNDFRSTKENIYFSAATIGASGPGLRAESGGSHAAQLTPVEPVIIDDADPRVVYSGNWTHAGPSAGYTAGDYDSTESFSNTTGDSAQLTFQGTGIKFISAYDSNLGIIDVYIDGTRDATLDLYGPSKQPGQVVYTKTGLAAGDHTIKIVVTGQKNPAATDIYALIDGFEPITGSDTSNDVVITVKNQWNYPDIDWGNYIKPAIVLPPGYTATTAVRLIGNATGP